MNFLFYEYTTKKKKKSGYSLIYQAKFVLNSISGSKMEIESTTGWLGNYKVSHIFPTGNEDEYLTVESHNGFLHIALHNISANTVDWRTEGNFEVSYKIYLFDLLDSFD